MFNFFEKTQVQISFSLPNLALEHSTATALQLESQKRCVPLLARHSDTPNVCQKSARLQDGPHSLFIESSNYFFFFPLF